MAFRELEKGKTHEVEMNILKTWEKMDILKQSIDNREGKENFEILSVNIRLCKDIEFFVK